MSNASSGTLILSIAAALTVLPSTAEAGGDTVYGTRGGEELREQDHQIELSFSRGHAQLRVRRTVHNGIERHDEAQFWLSLPWTSVATGLRSLGELDGKPKWFEAELLEAEAAAARYQELTGLGGYYPKDPALLSWRGQTELALQVFPVAPGTDKTVEYTLSMPAAWSEGRWRIWMPSLGTEALPAELTINPTEGLDQLFVDNEVVARGHRLTLDHDVEVALAPTDPAPYSLSFASIDTGERALAHWQLVLAPEISTIPSHAKIVLILDLSRSVDDIKSEAQRQVAISYLEHFADASLGAEVALLGFDREVHELSQGFVSAADAIQLLGAAPLQRRNGSDVGLALGRAADLLADASKRDARRIVLLSDFETASRLQPDALESTVARSKAILHLVDASQMHEPELWRDDTHGWSQLAASSEGVLWYASVPDTWDDDEHRALGHAVLEELARPVRIDQLALSLAGMPEDADCCTHYGESIGEGDGISDLMIVETSATQLSRLIVDGVVWNQPLHETAKPSAAAGDRWSALVFGSDVVWQLSEAEMMKLAMRGRAVSPVTSYLAIEPGVRPSTEGLEEWETGGLGLVGSGSGGGGSGIGIGTGRLSFDKQAWLEGELRDGWARCGGRGIAGTVALETQTDEILEVALTQPNADARDVKRRACMEQVTWSVELPAGFQGFETWTITL
jgi:von Willebrand factor type A domain